MIDILERIAVALDKDYTFVTREEAARIDKGILEIENGEWYSLDD
jgi:hypothetical protein